jgi:hypothetical protein
MVQRLPKLLPIIIAIVGIALLAGAASAYVNKSNSTAICEACGMEVQKNDVSTISITDSAGSVHYACSPMCAIEVAMYYQNCTLNAKCFSSGNTITLVFSQGSINSTSPSGEGKNVTVVLGMTHMMDKLVDSNQSAQNVIATYSWTNGPIMTVGQVYQMAQMKYSQLTIGYKPVSIPFVTDALIAAGVVLLAISPLEYLLVEKRRKSMQERKS